MNILEAAISQSLLIGQRFGIITTGTGYKYIYHKDVKNFMGATSDRFAGLVTTGLDVLELGDGERGYVEKKIKDAAKRIAEMGADVIILGCAGAYFAELVLRVIRRLTCGFKAWRVWKTGLNRAWKTQVMVLSKLSTARKLAFSFYLLWLGWVSKKISVCSENTVRSSRVFGRGRKGVSF